MSIPPAPARRTLVMSAAVVVTVLVAGLLLRALVIRSSWGELNGDEAYAGLQSLGVLRDGRFPVVMDGSVYGAVIDAYLLSPLLVFAGGSISVLKWAYVVFWVLAAVAVCGIARHLAGRRADACAAVLVWLAPGALLVLSTRAYMGYALGLAVATTALWAVAVVADQPAASARGSALVGFLAGLAFYIHPMWVTLLGPVVAVAAVVHHRDWRRWWLPAIAGALAANSAFLLWNATNRWPSLTSQVYPPGTFIDRLRAFATGLLPRAFGLRTFDGRWVIGKPLGLLIYALIIIGVVAGCVVMTRSSRRASRWIVPVGLVVTFPAMAMLPHLIYVDDGRYGIITFPLIAISLGVALSRVIASFAPRRALVGVLAFATLWVGITVIPFWHRQRGFDRAEPNAWIDQVIDRLDQAGIDHVAGSYWLILPLEFRSDQRIRTAVAGNPYVIRMPLSQRTVGRVPAEEVAFIFPPGDQPPGWLYLPLDEYRLEDLGGVTLYLPPAAIT
ncbi:MAG: hypothetical protein LH616_18400 [Ilumatobacteraceae bacterium]|nr:hypothetical protein [Ilumatobacteraceae bacterium]